MLSHHVQPGGSGTPQFLVTTNHCDGVTCHHTGATEAEVREYALDHAAEGDTVTFWTVAPCLLDGVHWQLVA
jgi:hypothetical protein